MHRFLLILSLLVFAPGCEDIDDMFSDGRRGMPIAAQVVETPVMNLHESIRQSNWGGGSCMWASTCNCLQWQGREDAAKYIRSHYSGGASLRDVTRALDKLKIDYAYTANGDEKFLEWSHRTRRGALIYYFTNHAICFVGFLKDSAGHEYAVLLDNNRVKKYLYVPRREFIENWRSYGGVALTPFGGSPAPPHLRPGELAWDS